MIQSSVLRELIADYRRKDIIRALVARFGAGAKDLEIELKAAHDDRLDDLITYAAICPSLDSFRERVSS
jgi:hypothetical protein